MNVLKVSKKKGEKKNEIEKLILRANIIFKETQSPVEETETIQIRLQKNALYKKYKEEPRTTLLLLIGKQW